ncbi:hypothetical protein C8034_v009651 [Colletotrichum sidae]|uniref:Uncharacterized protein n=1 Tax=Colletotrichum sidae TaxID=1347389 RepID=A0A4R8T1R4_9PEZI|nr:hypothetical protein C8034_v009651 [Colletotrichum sidae]
MGSNDSSARLGSQTIDFGPAGSPSESSRVESRRDASAAYSCDMKREQTPLSAQSHCMAAVSFVRGPMMSWDDRDSKRS